MGDGHADDVGIAFLLDQIDFSPFAMQVAGTRFLCSEHLMAELTAGISAMPDVIGYV